MAKVKSKTSENVEVESYPKNVEKRFRQLRFNMDDNKINGAFVTHLPNIRYLTNFSGSFAILLVKPDEIHFLTDDRYEEQVKSELFALDNLQVHITREPIAYCIKNNFLEEIETMGVESEYITYEEAIDIRQKLHSQKIKFKPVSSLVERYTQAKSPEEIGCIKASCKIAETVFEKMLDFVKPGMTELDVAIEIAYQGRKLGSEGDAFDIIAVSGSRGALVHGKPSNNKIKKNDILLMDFGCKVNGFCSDISRTICIGKPTKEQKAIYDLLYKAMTAAATEVRPGMKGDFLDGIARKMIEKAGYGQYFQHSLGHGLGLVCHENPIITFRQHNQIVPEDVVLAIEPGIYLPNKFGMRVEDNVLVTKTQNIKLTNAPSELISI